MSGYYCLTMAFSCIISDMETNPIFSFLPKNTAEYHAWRRELGLLVGAEIPEWFPIAVGCVLMKRKKPLKISFEPNNKIFLESSTISNNATFYKLFVHKPSNCIIIRLYDERVTGSLKLESIIINARLHRELAFKDDLFPTLSYNTHIYDYVASPYLVILRWPLKLHDRYIRSTHDQPRLISRQCSESKLREAEYEPLRKRSKPYPFFVPAVPLDPLWTPTHRFCIENGVVRRAASAIDPTAGGHFLFDEHGKRIRTPNSERKPVVLADQPPSLPGFLSKLYPQGDS